MPNDIYRQIQLYELLRDHINPGLSQLKALLANEELTVKVAELQPKLRKLEADILDLWSGKVDQIDG